MARIVITTDGDEGLEPAVLMEEWVLPEHFESDHFSAQFVERVGWAVADAHAPEARPRAPEARPRARRRGAHEAPGSAPRRKAASRSA